MDALLTDDTLLFSALPCELNKRIVSSLDDMVSSKITSEEIEQILDMRGVVGFAMIQRISDNEVRHTHGEIKLVFSGAHRPRTPVINTSKSCARYTHRECSLPWLDTLVGEIPPVTRNAEDRIITSVGCVTLSVDVLMLDVVSMFMLFKRRFQIAGFVEVATKARNRTKAFVVDICEHCWIDEENLYTYLSCLMSDETTLALRPKVFGILAGRPSNTHYIEMRRNACRDTLLEFVDTMV